jgi:PDZ domain-containing protein
VDTIEPMVVGGPLTWEPPPPQPSRRWLIAPVVAVILGVGLLAAMTVTIPYYALAPGSARQVNDLISGPPDRHYPPQGQVLMATVELRQARPIDVAESWFDHDIQLVKDEAIRGNQPPKQFNQANLQEMDDSKRTAVVVALRRLGYNVPAKGQGALITTIVTGHAYPAEGHLQVGEVVTSVDGQPVHLVEDAVSLLQKHQPGDTVRIGVQAADTPKGAGNATATRIEELVMARSDQGKAILGVELQTYKLDFDLPFQVRIESGDIGGPSAGLAFTLGVLDDLTPGELTGGVKVAATGTIESDGSVGDVGGVTQKTAAVIRAGAKVFLVPPGEYAEARKRAGSRLKVVKVTSLDDALSALAQLGGNVAALGPRPGGVAR